MNALQAETPTTRGVELVAAARLHDHALDVPPAFALKFPQRWRPRRLLNVHADAIERRTLAWLASFGIGGDAGERDKLRKFNCAMYGGYSLPVAEFEAALLVTQFICLWLFWDDMLVEEELGWDVEEVVRALTAGAARSGDSRYVAAWADIGRRLRRSRSPSWLERLGVTMRRWMENAKVETGLARAFKRGSCPEFCTAFACRTVSIGMYPTFHLIEHAQGTDRRVERWLRAVRYNVHGFTLWESTAERYQELKAIVDGKLLVAPVVALHEAG